jgi:ABC-type molybdate transport system permease subunit
MDTGLVLMAACWFTALYSEIPIARRYKVETEWTRHWMDECIHVLLLISNSVMFYCLLAVSTRVNVIATAWNEGRDIGS